MHEKSRIDAPAANVALCKSVGARVEFISLANDLYYWFIIQESEPDLALASDSRENTSDEETMKTGSAC
jgi:hypothetical protein